MRLITFILLTLPLLTSASSVAEAALKYESGEYENALNTYLDLGQEQTSASLLYNIGNCYFKLEELPESILYYERAARLSPADDDIKANLKLARALVVDRIAEVPTLELGNYWDRFKAGSDVDQWARLSLWTCLFGFLALTGLFFLKDVMRKIGIAAVTILFATTLFSMIMAAVRKDEVLHGSEAIIMANKVDIKSAPSDQSTDLFLLHEGTKVELIRKKEEWSEILLINGKVGWMPSDDLEII